MEDSVYRRDQRPLSRRGETIPAAEAHVSVSEAVPRPPRPRPRRRTRGRASRAESAETMDQLLDQFSTPPVGERRRDFRWPRAGGDGCRRGCGRRRKIRRPGSRAGIPRFGRADRIRRRADDRSRAAARAQRRLRAALLRARAPAPRLGTHREILPRAHQRHRQSRRANQGRPGGEYRRARVFARLADRAAARCTIWNRGRTARSKCAS